ncbi:MULTISPECIES: hypothetical protein [Variovorax]|uniref:hypothetical protein n=1 Tax=Variovorax TaxID=34072 RepID=UPI001ACD8F65|nr:MULTISPECIES: hypothetical protein [Variovorax]MBN8758320.1 hypothetical protein [Variovorax sp.]UKI07640.1 hypothetical protein L3V85_33395 [Variovorax paradoxus]
MNSDGERKDEVDARKNCMPGAISLRTGAPFSMCMCASDLRGTLLKQMPNTILRDLAWSFSRDTPESIAEWEEALSAYGEDIGMPVDREKLWLVLPVRALDVQYTYWVVGNNNEWQPKSRVVSVRASRLLSCSEILFEVHKASHAELEDQDHRFFEGLELLDEVFEEGVPAYKMLLGS